MTPSDEVLRRSPTLPDDDCGGLTQGTGGDRSPRATKESARAVAPGRSPSDEVLPDNFLSAAEVKYLMR